MRHKHHSTGAPRWAIPLLLTLFAVTIGLGFALPLFASDLSEHCGPGAFSPPAPQAECDTLVHQVPEAPTWALLLIGGLVGGWVARGLDE